MSNFFFNESVLRPTGGVVQVHDDDNQTECENCAAGPVNT